MYAHFILVVDVIGFLLQFERRVFIVVSQQDLHHQDFKLLGNLIE